MYFTKAQPFEFCSLLELRVGGDYTNDFLMAMTQRLYGT